ncbi:MAG TPA: hypothetical protein VFC10_15705 [Terriglobia bacterium]|jgi:hypothetical protein|nr:hypothetical protein [Terriglobia bacterium]
MGQKNAILQKRTGEVVENKGSALQNGTKRTGERTEQVLWNQWLWKNEPEKETGYLIENK